MKFSCCCSFSFRSLRRPLANQYIQSPYQGFDFRHLVIIMTETFGKMRRLSRHTAFNKESCSRSAPEQEVCKASLSSGSLDVWHTFSHTRAEPRAWNSRLLVLPFFPKFGSIYIATLKSRFQLAGKDIQRLHI